MNVKCPKCSSNIDFDKGQTCQSCGTYYYAGIECILCGGFVPSGPFGDACCEKCGQEYGYYEAVMIDLSDEQIQTLKDMKR